MRRSVPSTYPTAPGRSGPARRFGRVALPLFVTILVIALQLASVSCNKGEPSNPGDGNGTGDGTGLNCSLLGTWDGTFSLNEFTFNVSFTLEVPSVTGSLFQNATFAGTGPNGAFAYTADGSFTLTTFEFSWGGLPVDGLPYIGSVTGRFDLGCASFQGNFTGTDPQGQPVTGSMTGLKRTTAS